jgi:hypothetical protein
VTPKQQLAAFMAKYSPAIAKQAKSAIGKLDALMPGATRLVYDNYNVLVIAIALVFGSSVQATRKQDVAAEKGTV